MKNSNPKQHSSIDSSRDLSKDSCAPKSKVTLAFRAVTCTGYSEPLYSLRISERYGNISQTIPVEPRFEGCLRSYFYSSLKESSSCIIAKFLTEGGAEASTLGVLPSVLFRWAITVFKLWYQTSTITTLLSTGFVKWGCELNLKILIEINLKH